MCIMVTNPKYAGPANSIRSAGFGMNLWTNDNRTSESCISILHSCGQVVSSYEIRAYFWLSLTDTDLSFPNLGTWAKNFLVFKSYTTIERYNVIKSLYVARVFSNNRSPDIRRSFLVLMPIWWFGGRSIDETMSNFVPSSPKKAQSWIFIFSNSSATISGGALEWVCYFILFWNLTYRAINPSSNVV